MKLALLDYIVCPTCGETLSCIVTESCDDEILSAMLHCANPDHQFPVVRGIPRFVTPEQPLTGQNIDTAAAFGWEWQEFHELHDMATYQAQFLDWIEPIPPDYFTDKIILDAGCGMGRFSLVSSTFGAKQVLAIDASLAVEAAWQNARTFPNVHVIQGDIHHLPLRRDETGQVDFVFSIGVLHHLDQPQAGFTALTHHLKPEGAIFAWVYGRENNGWLVNMVNPIRATLTSRLPRQALYVLSFFISLFLHPLARYIYRPVNTHRALHGLRRLLFYNDYLSWLGQFGFRHTHHVVFDHLVAPVAFYIRREEFAAWFEQAGMEIIHLSWRNQNSWRGHGRFPPTANS